MNSLRERAICIGRAEVAAHRGNHDRAFDLLERAFEENPSGLSDMRVHRAYDPLREDPRFDDLLVRMGLDDASLTWLDEREAVPASTP
jgi:hypothetical protein